MIMKRTRKTETEGVRCLAAVAQVEAIPLCSVVAMKRRRRKRRRSNGFRFVTILIDIIRIKLCRTLFYVNVHVVLFAELVPDFVTMLLA
jgi:hypothetical protein